MYKNNIVVKNGKELRFGYTTGSCATAATVAACRMLLLQVPVDSVVITLPSGKKVSFDIKNIQISMTKVVCSVVKDAGDDPDVTDGIEIFAECEFAEKNITLKGGVGVGTVTTKGLRLEIGEPAINPIPRKMIVANVENVCREFDYKDGFNITIFVPEGVTIAKKTFNPRIGIVGGISILGTTGIVEPMSEKALIDTIKLLIDKQKVVNSNSILISPGNYGKDFCMNTLNLDIDNAVKCSNYIGETLDYIKYKEFKQILLVGHIGKLVKLAGGIMNTHSKVADCRMEILASHAAINGARQNDVKRLFECLTTDEAIDYLDKIKICNIVLKSILDKVIFHLNYRLAGKVEAGVVIFTDRSQKVYKSDNAQKLIKLFI